jgi:hypothetical protein
MAYVLLHKKPRDCLKIYFTKSDIHSVLCFRIAAILTQSLCYTPVQVIQYLTRIIDLSSLHNIIEQEITNQVILVHREHRDLYNLLLQNI